MKHPCASCGYRFELHKLDAKPSSAAFAEDRRKHGQVEALCRAADRGENFDRFECRDCYGPGYVVGVAS